MTQEERLKICQICQNRKFSAKEGILCGKIGRKPIFDIECEEFDVDLVEQERMKKNASRLENDNVMTSCVKAYIAFLACSSISLLISFLATAPISSLADLVSYEFLWIAFYVYFSIYAIYGYLKKKSDAIFIAKYISVIGFLFTLYLFFPDNIMDSVISLVIYAGFFIFLTLSKDVNNRIPKEERGLTKFNKIMLILSIITQILFYTGNIGGNNLYAATAIPSIEKELIAICNQNKKTLPIEISTDIYWIDMKFNGNEVEYIYKYKEGYFDNMTPEIAKMSNKFLPEILKIQSAKVLVNKVDELFNIVANTNKYGLRFTYFSHDGELLFSVSINNDEINQIISEGNYVTKRADFQSILDLFNTQLPRELFQDGILRKCTLSDDGKTLHYEIKLLGMTMESLNNLTPESMKNHLIHEILPFLSDAPFMLATMNQMNISFEHTAYISNSWKATVVLHPSDYNKMFNN